MNPKNQKGQALVELALSLMLLFTIVFGITEFGRFLYMKNTLTNAAREGARRASTTPTTPLNAGILKTYVEGCIPFDKTGLNVSITPLSPKHGMDTINVVVTLPFKPVVPLIITQLAGIPLRGEASMLYE